MLRWLLSKLRKRNTIVVYGDAFADDSPKAREEKARRIVAVTCRSEFN